MDINDAIKVLSRNGFDSSYNNLRLRFNKICRYRNIAETFEQFVIRASVCKVVLDKGYGFISPFEFPNTRIVDMLVLTKDKVFCIDLLLKKKDRIKVQVPIITLDIKINLNENEIKNAIEKAIKEVVE